MILPQCSLKINFAENTKGPSIVPSTMMGTVTAAARRSSFRTRTANRDLLKVRVSMADFWAREYDFAVARDVGNR